MEEINEYSHSINESISSRSLEEGIRYQILNKDLKERKFQLMHYFEKDFAPIF